MREIVFDTETTGLNPLTGDRMVEIGCVELFNRVETGRTFHAYFNPQRSMPAGAEAVHGLSEAFLSDKPCFHELVDDLIDFLGDCPLVAHNASFDFGFLNHELSTCGRPLICMTRMVDTLVLARTRHPGAKHSLDALCTRYGVDRSLRIKHGALIDAQLLAQCYVELTGGRQIGLSLADTIIIEEKDSRPSEALVGERIVVQVRPPRPHAPTEEELAAHSAFLATISDPIWARLDGRG
ncbi:DNA polymerase III subunit epsilon [Allosphingosinicella deserti]|uniref:DNA polymerase III subunit epsilon n=1 Tax=Allosphingosinicella deserti TaxID=2116704 RepID=A0A2P7QUE5_9SPHN|nr:DNA polymerase III subunit epsilon [Sphingomonas deserti]PSJ41579.1 DNA polymerase III subunit epsilon [Sphingomonas deserti]